MNSWSFHVQIGADALAAGRRLDGLSVAHDRIVVLSCETDSMPIRLEGTGSSGTDRKFQSRLQIDR